MGEKVYTHESHKYDKHAELHNHDVEKLNELIEQGKHARHEKAEQLDELRAETHEQAISAAETISLQSERDNPAPAAPLINKQLKDLKYERTLQSIRKDLSKPERALSKVVHNKTVDAVSSVADKTVARPSGLLSGSICAFLGSSIFLYITKHYGYSYNYLMFFLFFVGGFALGLLIELVFRAFRHAPKA